MKWILILEKDEREFLYLERIITRLGYRPYRAISICHGLNYTAENAPDAMIFGEQVSDGCHLDFCTRIKQNPAAQSIPAILVTTDRDRTLKIKALDAGYSQVVYRPLSIRDLYEKLELCLPQSRRFHIRAPMNFPVDILKKGERFTLETWNFGEGGMYLHTENPMPRKTSLDIEFALPGFDTLLRLKGKVAHSSGQNTDKLPAGIGIQFTNLEGSLRAMLCIYMENYLAMTIPLATTKGRLWCAGNGDVRQGYQTG